MMAENRGFFCMGQRCFEKKYGGVEAAPINNEHLRPIYKPHSVQWLAPSVQPSLWAARRRAARCSLPGAGSSHGWKEHVRRRAVSHRPQTISPLLGLAPDGGYLAACITANAGGLLHHLFTITVRP